MFTPITGWRAGVDAGLGAGRGLLDAQLGMPASIAAAMPPASSTSWMCCHARSARSWVSRST